MIFETKQLSRFSGKLLTCGVALISLTLVSCTSAGSDGPQLQLSTAADGSILADSLQSAADQQIAAEKAGEESASTENTVAQAQTPATQLPTQLAQTQTIESTPAENTSQAPRTSLFGSNKPAKAEAAQQMAALAPDAKLATDIATESAETPPQTATQAAPPPPTAPETAPQTAPQAAPQAAPKVSALFGSSKQANNYVAPVARPSDAQGSISRLFSDENANARSARQKQGKTATLTAAKPNVSSGSLARDYSYTLPGVRANGGIEIKHRNAVYDDSDIDADEADDRPSIQLASAPGMARLAPNGLRVQRETVDVACLKPQLVTMLKSLERHYRRPVMVTSGYRSPSYNRSVSGARKSLHMICAAADIQIDGISKWEIARYLRAVPGRGGVGTYCHTKSVHVDIGPERDWNWRCRGQT